MQTHQEQTLYTAGPFGHGFRVTDRQENGATVIDLPGPLVGEQPAHELRDRVLDLLELGARRFAINLTEVSHADSYGVGALAAVYNLVRHRGGRIKFFGAPARLVRMLASLRLDTVFDLLGDETSALRRL